MRARGIVTADDIAVHPYAAEEMARACALSPVYWARRRIRARKADRRWMRSPVLRTKRHRVASAWGYGRAGCLYGCPGACPLHD